MKLVFGCWVSRMMPSQVCLRYTLKLVKVGQGATVEFFFFFKCLKMHQNKQINPLLFSRRRNYLPITWKYFIVLRCSLNIFFSFWFYFVGNQSGHYSKETWTLPGFFVRIFLSSAFLLPAMGKRGSPLFVWPSLSPPPFFLILGYCCFISR